MKPDLGALYQRLYSCFGAQGWWPADSAFEVMIGAILTQNTSWVNVEKAISNLKAAGFLTPGKLGGLSIRKLSALIRPAGYYNLKAKRLRNFLDFFARDFKASIPKMRAQETQVLRDRLLAVNGIGPETADSILLYALNKPVFVVDAYTKRILSRHGLVKPDASYREVQDLFTRTLRSGTRLFNEYHALLVRLGKDYCLKNKPRCQVCPIRQRKSKALSFTCVIARERSDRSNLKKDIASPLRGSQ